MFLSVCQTMPTEARYDTPPRKAEGPQDATAATAPAHADRSQRPVRRRLAAVVLLAAISGGAAAADEGRLVLGAQSHFAQGWSLSVLEPARNIGVGTLRDSFPWKIVERVPGRYEFSHQKARYPEEVFAQGIGLTPVFHFGNPNHDDGFIPHSDAGREAMARFVDATLTTFPEIDTVEIGNEYNTRPFVSGPVAEAAMSERDDYYVALLEAVHERLTRTHPEVRILGGATHSIPVDYLREMFDLGALEFMDGLAIHPYTTPAERIGDQLDLLRNAMGENAVPIHATEFGQEFDDPQNAPSYLVKMVSAMGAAGVASAHWYALREQRWFENMELLTRDGTLTPAGRAFRFVQEDLLSRGNPVDVSPDPTAYAFRYGERAIVMWGEPRKVTFREDVRIFRADGERVSVSSGSLDPEEPLIVIADAPLRIGENVLLGYSGSLADSFHHFDLTNSARGPWSYFMQSGIGETVPLNTMGGGHKAGEPWTPYIGHEYRRPLAVTARSVRPVDFSGGARPEAKFAVLERFTAPRDGPVILIGHWDVADATEDGVEIVIRLSGEEIASFVVFDPKDGHVRDLQLGPLVMEAGDTLDIVTDTNATPAGDHTIRRIRIFETGPAPYQPGGDPR